jgi:hypothetical protein
MDMPRQAWWTKPTKPTKISSRSSDVPKKTSAIGQYSLREVAGDVLRRYPEDRGYSVRMGSIFSKCSSIRRKGVWHEVRRYVELDLHDQGLGID